MKKSIALKLLLALSLSAAATGFDEQAFFQKLQEFVPVPSFGLNTSNVSTEITRRFIMHREKLSRASIIRILEQAKTFHIHGHQLNRKEFFDEVTFRQDTEAQRKGKPSPKAVRITVVSCLPQEERPSSVVNGKLPMAGFRIQIEFAGTISVTRDPYAFTVSDYKYNVAEILITYGDYVCPRV